MPETISTAASKRWLQALAANAVDPGRWQAGQALVAAAAVGDVVIDHAGRAKAVVEAGGETYETSIKWPTLRAQDQVQLRRSAANQQALLLYLESAEGAALLPLDWDSMSCRCTCPDWAVPCEHMAALSQELGSEMTDQPDLLWWLWGMDAPKTEVTAAEYPEGSSEPWSSIEPVLPDLPWQQPGWYSLLADNPPGNRQQNLKLSLRTTLEKAASLASQSGLPVEHSPQGAIKLVHQDGQFLLDTPGQPGSFGQHMQRGRTAWFGSVLELLTYAPQTAADWDRSWRYLQKIFAFARWLVQGGQFDCTYRQRGRQGQVWFSPSSDHSQTAAYMAFLYEVFPQGMAESGSGSPLGPEQILEPLLHSMIGRWLWLARPKGRITTALAALHYGQVIAHDPRILQWLAPTQLASMPGQPAIKIDDSFVEGIRIQAGVQPEDQPFLSMPEFLQHPQWQHFGPALQAVVEPVLMEHPYLQRCLLDETWQTQLHYRQLGRFLQQCPPILERNNLALILPKAMQNIQRPKAKMKAEGRAKGRLNLDAIVTFSWQAALGEQDLSPAEFAELADWGEGLVRFRGQYVQIDPTELAQIDRLVRLPGQNLSLQQALPDLLAEEKDGREVVWDQSIEGFLQQIGEIEPLPPPRGLKAELRPYQLRGYQWIAAQTQWGFGLCLADDMGLGKTVQAAAWVLQQWESGLLTTPVLVVCPTTLLANWAKELERFTPDLRASIYHGSARTLEEADVIITTYGLLRRDTNLQQQSWHAVILDEAQNIKNPAAHQTRAVKKLQTKYRLALTGTPVENALIELWSIFDFLNPGYLGNRRHFTETMARPIESGQSQDKIEQLQRMVGPFLLRRMKTDRNVISDLPEKLTLDDYVYMQPEQAALYQGAVTAFADEDLPGGGLERQQRVMQMLIMLKQICNHPAQYLKKGSRDVKRSGKALRLIELLRSILESGEQALIFSQYRQMGVILQEIIQRSTKIQPLFFHGGLRPAERTELVEQFQRGDTPLMIVSLKAGGSGLNLTAASHVIHYDLWWNPAVENQATDRAYRIGQDKQVMVHRLITRHTFEEKIDEMIKEKQAVADAVITAGERWLSNLSDKELRSLFAPIQDQDSLAKSEHSQAKQRR